MADAVIKLSDVGDQVMAEISFGDAFDPASNAHQHANLLIGMMDQIATRQLKEVVGGGEQ